MHKTHQVLKLVMKYSSLKMHTKENSDSEFGYSEFNQWKWLDKVIQKKKEAIVRYEAKASNLKRPPGHPIINVSEC